MYTTINICHSRLICWLKPVVEVYIRRITISYNWVIISVVMIISSYQFALMLNASLFCIYIVKFKADLRVSPAIKSVVAAKVVACITVIELPTKRQKNKQRMICSFYNCIHLKKLKV